MVVIKSGTEKSISWLFSISAVVEKEESNDSLLNSYP
jgi:hypothetical protein